MAAVRLLFGHFRPSSSVYLNVPLAVFLQLLLELLPVHVLFLGDALEHLQDSWHHALQTAEVHVGAAVQQIKNLVGVLLYAVLNVHLSTAFIVLLAREGVVAAELIGKVLLAPLDLVVVELGIAVGHAHEQPGQAGELVVVWPFEEHAAPEPAVGRDARPGGHHDDGGIGIFWQQHNLPCRSSHGDFGPRGGIAEEVGAEAFLGGILGLFLRVPVGGTSHAQGGGVSIVEVSVSGGGDGIEPRTVRHFLAFGVDLAPGWDDPVGLSFPEGDLSFGFNDDVAGFSGGLGSDDAFHGLDLRLEGFLGGEGVQGQFQVLERRRRFFGRFGVGGGAGGSSDHGPPGHCGHGEPGKAGFDLRIVRWRRPPSVPRSCLLSHPSSLMDPFFLTCTLAGLWTSWILPALTHACFCALAMPLSFVRVGGAHSSSSPQLRL
eukprot:scaffold694_cov338-Pavlova_lutheri.AAC.1